MPKVSFDWESEYYDTLPPKIQVEEGPSSCLPPWFFKVEDEEWASEIDHNYEKAISRGSSYCCDLFSHIIGGYGVVFQPHAYKRASALVGQFIEGIFCVSHFAPDSRKGGVELLRGTLSTETPFVICVPEYLAQQLLRLGFRRVGQIPQYFAGEIIAKQVMVNKAVTTSHLATLLRWYRGE